MKVLSNSDVRYVSLVETELRNALRKYDFSEKPKNRNANAELVKVILSAIEVLKMYRRGYRAQRIVNEFAVKAGRAGLVLSNS